MPYITPAFTALRDTLLRDIKNLLPQANTSGDSDYFVRASSVASCVEGLYQHQSWIVRQIFPDTADTEYLEQHCALRDIYRKSATSSAGTAIATGAPGAEIALGAIIRLSDGRIYSTTETATIPESGTLLINVKHENSGAAGNVSGGIGGFVQVGPGVGVDSAVTDLNAVGGTDIETDKELLSRLLEILRRPPAGGNRHDYKRWAMSVPGVSAAFIYPLRRGLGTVDIVIVADDDVPSSDVLSSVQAYIDDVRPVTAKSSLVMPPSPVHVDVNIEVLLSGITIEQFTDRLNDGLELLFQSIDPGVNLIKSKIEAVVSNIPGVADRAVISPASNIEAVVDESVVEWIRMGALSVSLM